MNDLQTFATAMATLGAAFDKTLSKPKLDLFWDHLKDINSHHFEDGVKRWTTEQSRFPTIAQLRDYCDRAARATPPPPLGGEHAVCERCENTGYETFQKYVELYQTEVRYVRRCACWDHNPKLVADRERARRYHAESADKSRSERTRHGG